MVNRSAMLLLMIVLCLAASAESKPRPLPPMNAEKWRADVDYFGRELPQRHKNAFHTVSREKFAAEVAALRAKAGQANDAEMIVGLMKITAMVGDGHTYVRLPSDVRQLPIAIVLVEGAHRVVRGAGGAAELVGGKLIRIDDMPLDEATARIRTILPQAESETLLVGFTPQWFSIADVLHGLGISKSATAARFTVLLDDGTERSADVSAIDPTVKPQWRMAAPNPPLYRQKLTDGFWFTWLPEDGTVYVSFRKYDDLRAKSRELWTFVDSHPVRKIAIDLRQNGGGDFHVGRKYLVDELKRRPKIRAYVITGSRTFSAALKNSIDFREIGATLAGETIGERPNSYSENDELKLPNAQFEVSYSTKYYKFLPTDGLVVPDKEILPTWADWLAGRDPVMDWIAEQ
jgi:hypothetical protein